MRADRQLADDGHATVVQESRGAGTTVRRMVFRTPARDQPLRRSSNSPGPAPAPRAPDARGRQGARWHRRCTSGRDDRDRPVQRVRRREADGARQLRKTTGAVTGGALSMVPRAFLGSVRMMRAGRCPPAAPSPATALTVASALGGAHIGSKYESLLRAGPEHDPNAEVTDRHSSQSALASRPGGRTRGTTGSGDSIHALVLARRRHGPVPRLRRATRRPVMEAS